MDENLRREIIMDHYENPFHRQICQDETFEKINTSNASCIDNLDIYIKINQEKTIENIYFFGEACAISTSSTSIMITNLMGKTVEEALKYIKNFENMVEEKPYDEEILKEGLAYQDIYKQNNRKNCALLPYNGIKKFLENYQPK